MSNLRDEKYALYSENLRGKNLRSSRKQRHISTIIEIIFHSWDFLHIYNVWLRDLFTTFYRLVCVVIILSVVLQHCYYYLWDKYSDLLQHTVLGCQAVHY